MPSRPLKERPSIFLRVFLSHLILLLLTFITVGLLYTYLFAPGVKMFLQHSPSLILPALLGLIGLAGMLSLWTAAAISLPLEDLTEQLQGRRRRPAAQDGGIDPGTEEVKRLAELLHHVLPEHHAAEIEEIVSVAGAEVGALIVDVDLDGRITALSDAVSEALALPPEAIVGRGFFAVFSSGDMPADAASALIHPPTAVSAEAAPDTADEAATATAQPLVTTLHRGDDEALSIAWEGMNTFDDLGGINGRKLFGTPRRS